MVPVAWSIQGRHHCLRGGEEPPGLLGPVEGVASMSQKGETQENEGGPSEGPYGAVGGEG